VEANLKKSILALCALTLTAGLVACGGGTSSYTIGGVVTGLQYPGLVLTNNLNDDVTLKPLPVDATGAVPNVTYQFAKQLDYGDQYSVTVKTQPAHQNCQAISGTADTAGRLSVIEAVVSCALLTNTVGGTITGLAADGLELNNGSTSTGKIVKDPTTGAYPTAFAFAVPVTYGETYGVTVLTQPTGQTCTVKNGTGEMGDNAVASVEVTCVNNPV
jgi:hypothetical protein